jgi:hypothetical protein
LLQRILIPVARNPSNQPTLDVTRVTVSVHTTQLSGGNVVLYHAAAADDGTPIGNPADSDRPFLFYSEFVDNNGQLDPQDQLITAGDGSTPLFNVHLNRNIVPGYDVFWLGVSFAPVFTEIGWNRANGPDVASNVLYRYDLFTGTQGSGTGGPYYLQIEGNFAVPEPSGFALVGIGMAALIGFRRTRAN